MKGYKTRIICDGKTYESTKEAGEALYISPPTISAAIKRGREADGLFHTCGLSFDAVETDDPACLGKRVICEDTGETFKSMKEAAKHAGVSKCWMGNRLRNRKKAGGKRYRYA